MVHAVAPVGASPRIRSALDGRAWDGAQLVEELRASGPSARPFDERSLEFCRALSAQLLSDRRDADAVALGFWLRPASLTPVIDAFARGLGDRAIAAPRGLAFHVTPANVDTVFVHSWILSLLAGNRNIVRVSSRASEGQAALLEAIGAILADARFGGLADQNRIVTTAHDDELSRTLSAAADVRVIWGGDATVEAFRRFPLAPHAREVVFPDRHSLAIIDADAVLRLEDAGLARVARRFFADAYWYDQGACSSPRLVIWRGSATGGEATTRARLRFHDAVSNEIRGRGYTAETGAAINKMVVAFERAAGTDGVTIERQSNEVTWVLLSAVAGYDRASCGGGLFFELVSEDLARDLRELVRREDQTASCFGIEPAEIVELARSLNGQGIDRFVPMGRALAFDAVWDGMDLLREFTRQVVVDVT